MSRSWNIPSPPAPSGYDQWPSHYTTPYSVFLITEPQPYDDMAIMTPKVFGIYRYWEIMLPATVTNSSSYSKTITINTGVTTSETEVQTFAKSMSTSISVGAGIDFMGISASINSTIEKHSSQEYSHEHQVTLSKEQSISKTFQIGPAIGSSRVSVVFWQLIEEFRKFTSRDFGHQRYDSLITKLDIYSATQYPDVDRVDRKIDGVSY